MDMVLRVSILYIFIAFCLRVLGKREFSELSPLELVCLLLVPEIASPGLGGQDSSLTNSVIGISTIFALVFITSVLAFYFPRVERAVSGEPTLLISHGKLLRKNMRRERVTLEELHAEIREVGLENFKDVRYAVLETDGRVSVIKEHS